MTRLLLTSLAALAVLLAPSAAQADGDLLVPAPVPELTFDDTSRPRAVAVGDFDADGRHDLAVADWTGDRVHIRLGDGDGTFRTAEPLTGLDRPNAVVVGDFDADGAEDLAVAAGDPPKHAVTVLRGAGDGTFALKTAFGLPGGFARSLAAGDFNGDQRTDLVAAADEHVSLRLAAPDGTFGGGTDVPFISKPPHPSRYPQSVATGDFDGDGIEDVVTSTTAVAPGDTGTLLVLPGRGDGTFRATKIASLTSPALAIAVGDLDADQRHDVLAPVLTEDDVAVKLGKGDGTLPVEFDGPADVKVGDAPRAIAIADLDGDGHEDLAAANGGGDTVSVRLGDGAGGFADGGDWPVGDLPTALAAGDFDGDGTADLAVANDLGGTVSVRLGAGEPHLAGNLLANGGFEQGPGAGLPTQAPPIPGWATTGGMTAVRYGAHPHLGFPSRLHAPRFQTGGSNLLWGGDGSATGGITTATQVVDVGGSAAAIDGGRATAHLSAWLGGAQHYADQMVATAAFLDGAGKDVGLLKLAPVGDDDRRGLTTLVRRAGTAAVPAGTRRIAVTLTSVDTDTISSATADNVKLALDVRPGEDPPPAGPAEPEELPRPEEPVAAAGADTPEEGATPEADRTAPAVGRVRPSRSRVAAGQSATVGFTLTEAATVTVRVQREVAGRRAGGRCGRATRRTRGAAPCRRLVTVATLRHDGSAGPNRVRVSGKALRRGVHRLLVQAVDPAGNGSAVGRGSFRVVG